MLGLIVYESCTLCVPLSTTVLFYFKFLKANRFELFEGRLGCCCFTTPDRTERGAMPFVVSVFFFDYPSVVADPFTIEDCWSTSDAPIDDVLSS